jgi:hypothetical protein
MMYDVYNEFKDSAKKIRLIVMVNDMVYKRSPKIERR